MTARVCLLVDTYNSARFLETTLASITAQTRAPDEVLIIDDGSQDDSLEHARAWAARQAFPARALRNPAGPTGGPAGPLALGLANSSAEFVATLDGDDAIAPIHLARLSAILCAHPGAAFAFGDAALFREDPAHPHGRFVPGKGLEQVVAARAAAGAFRSSWDAVEAAILEGCFVPTCAYMMRRDAVEAIGGLDHDVGHAWDYALFLRLALHGGVAWTDEVLGWRREHPNAMSAAGDIRSVWPPMLVLAKLWSERDALELSPAQRQQLAGRLERLVDQVLYEAAGQGPGCLWRAWRATGRPPLSVRRWLRALPRVANGRGPALLTPSYLTALGSALTRSSAP